MTQESKELLLKYLCMALPYGVMIEGLEHSEVMTIKHLAIISAMPAEPYKPYLRQMSSMTDEEKKEYILLSDLVTVDGVLVSSFETFNWLLEHHFDFMNLIPKNMAIEVTENNNPYKE